MKKCFEEDVEWWQIRSSKTHLLSYVGKCKEVTPDLYVEFPDGRKEYFANEPDPESIWNFDLIPIEEYDHISELIRLNKKTELLKIHNKYLLSGKIICCEDIQVIENFKTYFL